ncbi:hypothetical protein [Thiomicrorhabdus cannonii]|uniref:hypothetical protein n=1 Tax=Thiomicrorhabdus cannonii TaxID=2748011 RepID=UPI0015BE55CC|nr:hypothetical protein [Thiomicrorhabdus cannonii]
MSHDSQSTKLANIAKKINERHSGYLDTLKQGYSELERDDFIWHFLLQSFSTMGRSSGWKGLIGNKDNYNRITFQALSKHDAVTREKTVKYVCRTAKVRMPDKKAQYILGCYDLVTKLGGLKATKSMLLAEPGREAKIKFLKQFPGIGPKYARNIMMDVYHEDFRDSIAIDARIKAISETLGLSFRKYEEHEKFFQDVASKAGLNGWELDRLMYNFRDDFERGITNA